MSDALKTMIWSFAGIIYISDKLSDAIYRQIRHYIMHWVTRTDTPCTILNLFKATIHSGDMEIAIDR